jgi:hypothetical protein
MKQCTKCKQTLLLEQFSKCKLNKDGLQFHCKDCKKYVAKQTYNTEYFQKQKQKYILPYHIVYLLPEHNYVGVTNRPYTRMINHTSEHNRNTNNWVELKRFDNRKDALIYEAELHTQGYEGAKP